ncbi:MAG: phage tail protein [Nitratireductor sp.]|uniref:phage tail protein n=1 Tax=Nitratireductor sp. TaxID=1872084 RepID=UPI00262DD7FE|nr:phage tail protein [Nitratireductor sp.]MCV0351592.1 phage tail protein [Nitratireductor sp.]
MAILVAVGGAALGSAVGVGWQAGWLVGSVVGSLLFPAKGQNVTTEGPRLGDLTVSSSAYGASIAIGYGTLRMAGNMIWSSGIREQQNVTRTRSGGKGGGGATQTSVTYSYFASFALSFGEGPAEDVLRIWADGKLIYDKTGASADVAKPDLKFRFHSGTEDQLADPLIEMHVGAGRAPAHRGLATIVFEDLALADFGNRIPNITAEITYQRAAQQPYQLLDFITTGEGGYFGTYQIDDLAVDWRRGYGYFLDSDVNAAEAGIRRFSLRTMKEDRQARMTDITAVAPNNFPSTLFCGEDGHLYVVTGSSNSRPILRIEPNALKEVGRFGSTSSGLTNSTLRFVATTWMGMVSAYGPSGRVDFVLTGSLFDDVGLIRADTMGYVWGAGQSVTEPRVRGVIGGVVGEGFGDGWILGSGTSTNHGSLGLYRLRVSALAGYDGLTGQSLGVTFEKVATFAASDVESGATGFYGSAGGLTYDTTDDSVIFQARISNGGSPGAIYTLKWRSDTGIVWKTVVPTQINYEGPYYGQSRLRGQRWTLMRGTRVIQLDTASGALVLNEIWPGAVSEGGAQVYDAVTDTHLVRGSQGWAKLFLNRGGGGGETLSGIVSDLCARAGLGLSDIDVADLGATVPGYVIGRQTTVRGAIEPLAQAYFFDAAESDDALRFRTRGRPPAATIEADLLLPLDERTGESWRERRTQEVELPERVSVVYMDAQADYQQGTQSEKRTSLPLPTMHSRNQSSVELALALDATTAKQIAAKTLYSAWIERSAYEAELPADWLRLDPTDVVDVVFESGSTFRTRITRLDVGADFSLAVKGVSEAAATYVSNVAADGGSGKPVQIVGSQAATRLILPDLSLLRDIDDTGGSGSRIYYLMGGFGGLGWPGASLYRSADGTAWAQVGRSLSEAAWGATANALGTPTSPFATDETNSLTVFMTTGGERLESVTQDSMLSGANAALVLKANGEPEIIQFRDVTLNPDGSYTLSGLLRGRRGTDVFVDGHEAGELFVLLDPDDVETMVTSLGDLDLPRSWRAVGFGTIFEDAETLVASHTGRDLKPYAPWNVQAALTGSPANISLSWVRRTRIGGELKDGTGLVPLGETSEAYEIDILSTPGGAVKRTLTSTSPSVVYANADILADFGVVPSSLTVAVYQVSAVAGRGFPRTVTLEIN